MPTVPVRKRKRKYRTKPLKIVPIVDNTTVNDTVTLEEYKKLRGDDGTSDKR
jgi:hypothetical protein